MEQAFLAHVIPGRLRLKVPARQGDAEYFQALTDSLLTFPQTRSISVNPATGSALLQHTWPSAADFARDCQQQGLLDLHEPPTAALWRQASSSMQTLNQHLNKGGPLGGLNEAASRKPLLAMLVIMGMAQLARGQVMAPAVTLFWYALELSGLPETADSKALG